MVKSTTKAVQKSIEKAGKKRRSFNLTPEYDAKLQALAKQHGSMQKALEAMLDRDTNRNQPSNEALLAMLKERMK
ncbi:MAG: hypothetical protein AAFP81_01080 [Pseudomonadota bacterium]